MSGDNIRIDVFGCVVGQDSCTPETVVRIRQCRVQSKKAMG